MDSIFAQSGALDPRVIRSRKRLADALIRLALDRQYDTITIQAVVDAANLGYATFHRHYRSIDELLESILMPVWDALQQGISQQDTLYDESLMLFRFVKDHPDLWRTLLCLPESNPVRRTIDSNVRDMLIARWERHHDTSVPFGMSIAVIEYLTERLIRFYLANVNKYSPEQMAIMHLDLALKTALTILRLRDGWVLAPAC